METLKTIHTRRSIRAFTRQPIAQEAITQILEAAMAAPSAGNQQPWEFIVINDPQILKEVPKINPYAEMAPNAPAAILVCGNLESERFAGYWVIDCSAAIQNMLLAAHALGLGAVWTGIYPMEDRIAAFRTLVGCPQQVIPHSLVVFGYPAQELAPQNRFKPERIHQNTWNPIE